MEKTTKMIAAAVVLVLCAVAVIGVGYAYTATTVNSGNTADNEYIVLSQDGAGKYTFADNTAMIYYNTKNTAANTTTYELDGANEVTINSGEYHITKVGKTFTIKADQTGAIKDSLTCTVTARGNGTDGTGFIEVEGYVTLLKIVMDNTTTWMQLIDDNTFQTIGGTGSTFTISKDVENDEQDYKDSTVEVYFGYSGTTAPTTLPAQPIKNATLEFTVNVATA